MVGEDGQHQLQKRTRRKSFLLELWNMLSDETYKEAISWCNGGTGIAVTSRIAMEKKVLPNVFSHNNYDSFRRQLNSFGFRNKGKSGVGTIYVHPQWTMHNKGKPLDLCGV